MNFPENQIFVLIKISNGPQLVIRLRARVVTPSLKIENETLDFGDIRCGEARIVTIQLYNPEPVRCEWAVLPEKSSAVEEKRKKVLHE